MTSSTRRWNGPTGTTTDGCTASSATSHPPSSKPPTTLNQRHSNRSRHKYEVGNEPGTVHESRSDPDPCRLIKLEGVQCSTAAAFSPLVTSRLVTTKE